MLKYYKSKLFLKPTKIKHYTAVVRSSTLTYSCEIWPLTKKMEQKVIMFENKILKKIGGPIFDTERNKWRKRYNNEVIEETAVPWITNYVKSQGIELYGHAMRRENTERIKATINWNLNGKRPTGRPQETLKG